MKVVKEGRQQKGWSKSFACTGEGNKGGGCRAILLVEENDLFKSTSYAMGERTDYITFSCCECGVWTDIWKSDGCEDCPIPQSIYEKLPNKIP